MIHCQNICAHVQDFRIAIQCSIEEGSFFSILGPSGAGKSTFLRVLAGLLIPDKGSCIVRGKDILCLAPEKRRIGMVFQDYALFPHMNVYQNIEYGLKVQRRIPAERQKIVTQLLEEFSLTKKALQKPYHLSGGEQQRVALARALAPDPDMLLLDEPLSAVDIYLRDELRSLIKELQRRRKISTFYVTHDRQEALALSDTIAIFKEGRIVQVGSPEDVYTHPHNAYVAQFTGEANFLSARVLHRSTYSTVVSTIVGNFKVNGSPRDSTQCTIFFRPEDIVVLPSLQGRTTNVIEARIRETFFYGAFKKLILYPNIVVYSFSRNEQDMRYFFISPDHIRFF